MKRYFCLCPYGIASDKDASMSVDSFGEIESMLNSFCEELEVKFVSYKTQHILDKSPDKFPYWGRTYMVLGLKKDGGQIPLGYCNFEKNRISSLSFISIALFALLVLSVTMCILSVCNKHFDAALWSYNCAVLVTVIRTLKKVSIKHKLLYLLK